MPRAQCIVLCQKKLLMAKHQDKGKEWWCLPGGRVEAGETPAQAAVRELKEECCVEGLILYQTSVVTYPQSKIYTFLVDIGEQTPRLGTDPEFAHDNQALIDVQWLALDEIVQRDRTFLWAGGLLGIPEFLAQVLSWGDEINYPKSASWELEIDQVLESLPEVQAGQGLWQNCFHEYDVYVHTLRFVTYIKGLTGDLHLIAAGYLHDIGKPQTAKPLYDAPGTRQERESGKPYHTFTGHEEVGEKMVQALNPTLFQKLGLDQERIAALVGCHYLPMKGIKAMRHTTTFDEFVQAYHRLAQRLADAPVPQKDILLMFLADKLAQGKFCTDRDELFAIRNALLEKTGDLKPLYALQKEMYGNKE